MADRGTFAGRVDGFDGINFFGWVVERANPQRAIAVEIREGGRLLAAGQADRFRKDLKDNGFGDGRHAFRIPLPPEIYDGRSHDFAVVAVGAGPIPGLPGPLTLPTAPRHPRGRQFRGEGYRLSLRDFDFAAAGAAVGSAGTASGLDSLQAALDAWRQADRTVHDAAAAAQLARSCAERTLAQAMSDPAAPYPLIAAAPEIHRRLGDQVELARRFEMVRLILAEEVATTGTGRTDGAVERSSEAGATSRLAIVRLACMDCVIDGPDRALVLLFERLSSFSSYDATILPLLGAALYEGGWYEAASDETLSHVADACKRRMQGSPSADLIDLFQVLKFEYGGERA